MSIPRNLRLYLTPDHPCPYLPGRVARNLVVDPDKVGASLYCRLMAHGFRRSGSHVYRPHCEGCNACQSLRVPVGDFRPGRFLRRAARKNEDLQIWRAAPNSDPGTLALYRRYIRSRHPGGGMDQADADSLASFLTADWCSTGFYEIRRESLLLGVAVTDELGDCMSAVYTFFEPSESGRGLGNWAILKQSEFAARQSMAWLYLGYWIRECDKMAYKSRFRPHERYLSGYWLKS